MVFLRILRLFVRFLLLFRIFGRLVFGRLFLRRRIGVFGLILDGQDHGDHLVIFFLRGILLFVLDRLVFGLILGGQDNGDHLVIFFLRGILFFVFDRLIFGCFFLSRSIGVFGLILDGQDHGNYLIVFRSGRFLFGCLGVSRGILARNDIPKGDQFRHFQCFFGRGGLLGQRLVGKILERSQQIIQLLFGRGGRWLILRDFKGFFGDLRGGIFSRKGILQGRHFVVGIR